MKRQTVRHLILLISLLLFPLTLNYFSPYLIVVGASRGIITGSFIIFSVLLLSSLFLGRFFCGWLCPAGGLQEACFGISRKPARGGRLNWLKYIIWVPWITAIIVLGIWAGGFIQIDPLYMTESGISVDDISKYIIYYSVVLIFFLLAVLAGRRSACHYICWMAPFMVIGDKFGRLIHLPSLHLESRPDKCIDCKRCNQICPMSLSVSTMALSGQMKNSECILCGECIDHCPRQVLSFHFLSQRPKPIISSEKSSLE